MKQGRSLVDVATEIQRQAQSKKDFIASSQAAGHARGWEDRRRGQHGAFPVTDLALTQIGERTGIPAKYLRRMQAEAPKLLASNVNHWFKETPERRMVRTLDGNIRAFLSDRYMRVDNTDVAKAVLPVLQQTDGLRILSTQVTEHRLYIKASNRSRPR